MRALPFFTIFIRFFSLALLLASIGACNTLLKPNSNKKVELPIESKATTNVLKEAVFVNPDYKLAKPIVWKQEHVKLKLSFDIANETVFGDASLEFTPLNQSKLLVIDAKGFTFLSAISIESKDPNLGILKTDYSDSAKLKIELSRVCHSNDTLIISFKYAAKPAELYSRGLIDVYSDQGLYFINSERKKGTPTQIWTQGETESNSAWMPCIDAPNQKISQEIQVTIDTPYSALSNGRLVYMLLNNNGTRTFTWKQNKKHAPYLSMLAIGNFAIIEDEAQGKLPVYYYVEPEYAKYAKLIFGKTPEMISFFSKTFGYNYPWDKYAQVAVREFVSGAMENTSATTIMNTIQHDSIAHNDNNYEDYISHELAHQWFGDLVTCESWANLALNEAFATYAEYLWIEYSQGTEKASEKLKQIQNAYFTEASYSVHPLIYYHYNKRDDMFNRHSYQKGALVLHTLRKHIGDEAFFKAIGYYLHKMAFKTVDVDYLRIAFEESSGMDLALFFDQWFKTANHPRLFISGNYNDTTKNQIINIKQEQFYAGYNTFSFKMPIQVYYENGTLDTFNFFINQSKQEIEMRLQSKPSFIYFNFEDQPLISAKYNLSNEQFMKMLASDDLEMHRMAMVHLSSKWLELSELEKKQIVEINNNWKRTSLSSDMALLVRLKSESVYYDISPLLKSANNVVLSNTIDYLTEKKQASKDVLLNFITKPSYLVKIAAAKGLENFYGHEVEQVLLKEFKTKNAYLSLSIARIFSEKGSKELNVAFQAKILKNPNLINDYSNYLGRNDIGFVKANLPFYVQFNSQILESRESTVDALENLKTLVKLNLSATEQLEVLDLIDRTILDIKN